MNALSPENRLHIFETFFPQTAEHIEAAWQFTAHTPYQIGYRRKSFRAPGHDELYGDLRSALIHNYLNTQRRESEKLAVEIAMENLARAAGYPDPARLGRVMEARWVADLRDGPIHKTVET